ncbi:N,N'-diacetylchitobiose phosphorylase [compost metagenome]
MYVAATQYIMGIKADLEGLRIDPCIPSEWEGFTAKRRFRGCEYQITVTNTSRSCKGVKEIRVDGRVIDGNVLPVYPAGTSVQVEVVL